MRSLQALAILVGIAIAASAGLIASSAQAAGLAPPVADCYNHGRLTRHYSIKQLENGLATMPAEVTEYSNCHDVLQSQVLLQLGRRREGGGAAGGGGSFLPTWLIVVLAVLVVTAAGFGALALRQSRNG